MSNINKRFKEKAEMSAKRGLRMGPFQTPDEMESPIAQPPQIPRPRKPTEYKFADGGQVLSGMAGEAERKIRERQRMLQGLRSGGKVEGPGGPTDDAIPAMLSDGEYVLPADTVKAVGVEKLEALRKATHTPVNKPAKKNGLRAYVAGGEVVSDAARLEEARRRQLFGTRTATPAEFNAATQARGANMGPQPRPVSAPVSAAPAPAASAAAPKPSLTSRLNPSITAKGVAGAGKSLLRGGAAIAPVVGAVQSGFDQASGFTQDVADRLDVDSAGGAAGAAVANTLRNAGDVATFNQASRAGQGFSEAAPEFVDLYGDMITGNDNSGAGGRLQAAGRLLRDYNPVSLARRVISAVASGDTSGLRRFATGYGRDTDRQQFEARQQQAANASVPAPTPVQADEAEAEQAPADPRAASALTPGNDPTAAVGEGGLESVAYRDPLGRLTGNFRNRAFDEGRFDEGDQVDLGENVTGSVLRQGDGLNNFTGRGQPQTREDRMEELLDSRTRSLLRQQTDLGAAQLTRENREIAARNMDGDRRGPDEQARRELEASNLAQRAQKLIQQGRAPEARALLAAQRATGADQPAAPRAGLRRGENPDQLRTSLDNVNQQLANTDQMRRNERAENLEQGVLRAKLAEGKQSEVREREAKGMEMAREQIARFSTTKADTPEEQAKYQAEVESFMANSDPRGFQGLVQALTGDKDVNLDSMYSLPPAKLQKVTQAMATMKSLNDKINAATGSDLNLLTKPQEMDEVTWNDMWNRGVGFGDYLKAQLPLTADTVLRDDGGRSFLTKNLSAEELRTLRMLFPDQKDALTRK